MQVSLFPAQPIAPSAVEQRERRAICSSANLVGVCQRADRPAVPLDTEARECHCKRNRPNLIFHNFTLLKYILRENVTEVK
jgi:hypothetical protein